MTGAPRTSGTAPARPAATVIVLRAIASEPCALMVLRNPALNFFGGYWVFPGGAVDPADRLNAADTLGAAAIAGCREVREEVSLELDPDRIVHWSRWITPSSQPKRFDTQFFVSATDAGQDPRLVAGENVALDWLPVARWPSLAESGSLPVPAPTQLVLREVAEALDRHGSIEALLEQERGRAIRCVLLKMTDDGRIVLPWDADYATLPGEGLPWDAVGIASRRHWPSRL